MLAAYRGDMQPPDGRALRELIDNVLQKPSEAALQKVEKKPLVAQFAWTEYEQLMVSEAMKRGESVFFVAAHITTRRCPLRPCNSRRTRWRRPARFSRAPRMARIVGRSPGRSGAFGAGKRSIRFARSADSFAYFRSGRFARGRGAHGQSRSLEIFSNRGRRGRVRHCRPRIRARSRRGRIAPLASAETRVFPISRLQCRPGGRREYPSRGSMPHRRRHESRR